MLPPFSLFHLEDKQLILLLFVHDQVFARNDSNHIIVLRYLNSYDLVNFSRLCWKKRDWNGPGKLKCRRIEDFKMALCCCHEHILSWDHNSFLALIIVRVNTDPQIVHEFPLINVEAPLIFFVSYAVSDSLTEHHLIASHEVIHYVFQFWHEVFKVNQVKVDQLFRYHLNSYVSFNEVDKPSRFDFVVKSPLHFVCYYIFFLFKKQNFGRTSCY